LGTERYTKDGQRLLSLAVKLAQEAVRIENKEKTVKILGSIPPICGSYEPEKFDPNIDTPIVGDFLDAFVSTNGSVNAILLETVGSIHEAKCYMNWIVERNISLPVWVSFCLGVEEGHNKIPTLLSGETITQAIEAIVNMDKAQLIQAILVNCCDMRLVSLALSEAKQSLEQGTSALDRSANNKILLGAYPNAFSIPPPNAANHSLRVVDYNITPESFQDQVAEWSEHGATILGGCCGVSPDHIAKFAALKRQGSISS